jgi:subtilase-type serine protease
MTQSTNIVNTLTLVDNLYEDANNGLVSQDVVNRINNYIIAAGTTLAGNVELIEVALKQLAGEEALSSITASIDTARAFNTAISDRFTTLRTFNSTAPSAGAGDTLNRLWLSGFGNWSKLKDSAFTTGYKYTGGGVVLGYDRDVEAVPGLSVGLSGAWSKGKLKNNDGLSNTDINTGSFGLYSSYLFKNGFFIDALFSYGQSNNDTSTTQIIGNAIKEASYDTKSYLLGLNFGYDIPITDNIKLTPSAGVNYLSVHQDGWIESIVYDPLNLSLPPRFVSSSKNDIVEIPLNLKLSGNFTSDGGIDLNFGVRAGVVIEAEKPNNSLNTGFVGSSRSAVITGVSYGRSRFKGGASLGLQLSESVDVFFDYDIEARKQYTSHNATLGFGFSF